MFEVDISNNTDILVALHLSPVTYGTIVAYHSLITILSLIGNLFVLYGTHRFNAMSIDAITLVFIKFLAVTDIAISLISCVPILTTLAGRLWILGEKACFVLAYLMYIPGIAQTFIILEFTLYKLVLLVRPMTSVTGGWSERRMSAVFVVTYILASAHTCGTLLLSGSAVYVPAEFSCNIDKSQPGLKIYGGFSIIFISFLPAVLIIAVNIALLVIARRACKAVQQESLPSWRAIVITLCVSWIYALSALPKGILNILVAVSYTPPAWLPTLQKEIFFLNTACNPIVYTAANTTFRQFVLRRITRKLSSARMNMAEQLSGLHAMRRNTMELLAGRSSVSENVHTDC